MEVEVRASPRPKFLANCQQHFNGLRAIAVDTQGIISSALCEGLRLRDCGMDVRDHRALLTPRRQRAILTVAPIYKPLAPNNEARGSSRRRK